MTNQQKNLKQALTIKPSTERRSGRFISQHQPPQLNNAACSMGNCQHGSCSGIVS